MGETIARAPGTSPDNRGRFGSEALHNALSGFAHAGDLEAPLRSSSNGQVHDDQTSFCLLRVSLRTAIRNRWSANCKNPTILVQLLLSQKPERSGAGFVASA